MDIQQKAKQVFEKLDWTLTPDQITRKTQEIESKMLEQVKQVEELDHATRTFENTVWGPSRLNAEISDQFTSLYFPSYVSTDAEVRKASTEAVQRISNLQISLGMREKSYLALRAYASKGEELDVIAQKLVDKGLEDFRRNGLELDEEKRKQLEAIRKEISEKSIAFGQNNNENKDFILVAEEDLKGIPSNIMNSLPVEDGKLRVDIKGPNMMAIMDFCDVQETRRRMNEAWDHRDENDNIPLFQSIISLRQQAAELLGYEHHADYQIEVKMAKKADRVSEFIDDLIERLFPHGRGQLDKLLELKRETEGEAEKINFYDWRYYNRLYKERAFDIDYDKVKEYFPTEDTVEAMLAFYQKIFGFTFYPIEDAPTWHEDVRCFAITDTQTGDFKGVFFLDLFPREGKFSHAAAFPLIRGRELADGSYQHTAAAMVCNFNKSTPQEPSQLTLSQVKTLFHEFGHIIHQTTTRGKYARFSGSSVAGDFVEAPSQMLENWVLERQVLDLISRHYQTGEKLPEEIRLSLVKADTAMEAIPNLRQLFFGKFDMICHTQSAVNVREVWFDTYKKILMMHPPQACGVGSFGHLVGGYSAGYYGYMWANSISHDLYTRFKKEGVVNPEVGMDYRRYILEPGSTIDEMDLVRNFLGREPNNKAFMEYLGLT